MDVSELGLLTVQNGDNSLANSKATEITTDKEPCHSVANKNRLFSMQFFALLFQPNILVFQCCSEAQTNTQNQESGTAQKRKIT